MPVTPELLAAFVAMVFLISVVPGPDVVFVVASGLRDGRRGGVAAALGVTGGMAVHTLAAALGLSALVRSSATAFEAVRLAGAGYLVWLGVHALRSQGRTSAPTAGDSARRSSSQIARQAALTNLLNPKVIVFFLAFLPQFVDRGRGEVAAQILLLGVVFTLVGLTTDLAYGVLAGTVRRAFVSSARLSRRLERLVGVIYLGLAARLMSER
ncbi:MAG TPA: LysE family translocator [Thermoleophilaceae bacterium]|nr:LysE family translocator [Thermoleophilaceae bacterium]